MTNVQRHLGWFAVMCLLLDWMLWVGVIKGLGFMLPTFKEQFEVQTWLIGWMVAIVVGVINFAGIFAGPLSSLIGTRAVVMMSGLMAGCSLILSSFASGLPQITFLLAFGLGPGISCANILCRVTIAQCFESNYGTANGIAQAGSPLGLIVVAPLVQLFLDIYGWRGAFLLLGGITLHLVVCGALLRQPSIKKHNQESYRPVSSSEHGTCTEHEKPPAKNTLKETVLAVKSRFGFSICFRLSFWVITTIFVSNSMVDTFWCIYYVDHVVLKGFTANDAIVLSTVAGVVKLFFKILVGVVVDKKVLKLRPAMAVLAIGCAISLITDPWMKSYGLVLVNVAIYTSFAGALNSLTDVYARELLGTELLASAFSWMELINGVLIFVGGFLPGLIHDMTGSYDVAFIIMGCLFVPSLVALLVERYRPKREA
ncbi:monocarboxylate transporter 12-like [Asterias amurensis]|uniref:monocarboxylate transporter 12-like n=1 Tax=Asterias amurensis TaxID=7602 RepID=UPI003AB7D530